MRLSRRRVGFGSAEPLGHDGGVDTTTILLLALGWPVLSLAAGVVVGRVIRQRDGALVRSDERAEPVVRRIDRPASPDHV